MNKIICIRRFLIGIILVISILVTCVGCATRIEGLPTKTDNSQVTHDIVDTTIIPSQTPSKAPEPSDTVQTPTQLSKQEKKTIIANFIRTNNHCDLPCFMGVKLQQSTLDEIEALFSPSMGPGLITRYPSTSEIVFSSGFETDNFIRGEFKIHLFQGEVNGISFYLGGMWRPEVSMEDWAPYTLKGVFSQLGPPSRIVFNKQGPPSESSDQGMIIHYSLIYEPNGTIIAYHGQKTDDVPKFHFCPMQQKPEFIGVSIGSYTKDLTVSGTDLEEASMYTVKGFYELDWNNPDTCIDLNTAVLKSNP